VIVAAVLALKSAQLPLLFRKQLLDARPLRGIGFRREQPPVMLYVEPSDILR
jgi:hypothetical protein